MQKSEQFIWRIFIFSVNTVKIESLYTTNYTSTILQL
jgi:hypothetical protein